MWPDTVPNPEPVAHESEMPPTAPRGVRQWCIMSIVVPNKIYPNVLK